MNVFKLYRSIVKASFILLLAVLSPAFLFAQREIPEGFNVLLSEDFDGETLNGQFWTKGLWGAANAHLFPNKNDGGGRQRLNNNFAGYVVDSNAVISSGFLELQNVKETINGTDPKLTLNFTNAMVNTLGKVKFNGSKNEIRIKMRAKFPTGSDVWPSVWLVAQYDWPPEIDVWEYFGQWFQWGKKDVMKLSWIYGSKFKKQGDVSWKYLEFNKKFNVDEFHLYEFVWNDKYMISKIDGTEFSKLTRGGDGEHNVPDNKWPDKYSEYSVIIQNGRMRAVVDQYGLENSVSNVFKIDYIDIYEKDTVKTNTKLTPSRQNLNTAFYPNPISGGTLHIEKDYLPEVKNIQVFNLSGQLELIIDARSLKNNTIDVSKLQRGLYFFVLQSTKKTIIQKLIVD